jgi:hypothetical protein
MNMQKFHKCNRLIGAGLLLALILFIFKTPVLWLIGASGGTFAHTSDYFSVINIFMPIAVAGTVSWYRPDRRRNLICPWVKFFKKTSFRCKYNRFPLFLLLYLTHKGRGRILRPE